MRHAPVFSGQRSAPPGVNLGMSKFLLLLLLLAPALAAQDSQPLSGTVSSGRRLNYLYSVDFGAGTAYSIACNLNTPSSNGLLVRLLDLDSLAGSGSLTPTGIDEAIVAGSGTANVSLSGTYAGVHEFVIEVESGGAGSTFSGNITLSAGTLTLAASDQFVLATTGFKSSVARLAFWNQAVTGTAIVPSSFEVDLGPVPTTKFFRFDVDASNINDVQVLETTGGSSTILATISQAAMPDATSLALTGSGKRTLRVNVRGLVGAGGFASWAVTMPTGVAVTRVGEGSTGSDDEDKGGCAAGAAPLAPVALAGLPLLALWRRRRVG